MTTNDALFVEVLATIETRPDEWNQTWWGPFDTFCRTAYCFAGWAAVLSGASPLLHIGEDDTVAARFADRTERIDIAACRLLGVESDVEFEDTTLRLFESGNTKDDLYRISAEHLGVAEDVLRDKVRDRVCELTERAS